MGKPRFDRIPLLAPAMLALLAGLWTGLLRLGLLHPAPAPAPGAHGPLMVTGFLGTLIALERAVALGRRWAYAAPAISGAGAVALIVGAPWPVAPVASCLAGALVVATFLALLRRERAFHLAVMASGAIAWLAGSLAWLSRSSFPTVAWWWAGFLVLTIVGERIELNRVLRLPRSARLAIGALALLLLASLALAHALPTLGTRVVGGVLVAIGLWLAVFDVARHSVAASGLTRYVAVCLLAGYAWLAAGGAFTLVHGHVPAGPIYDAQLHAILVGFVMSMVLGHAPVVFPAVLGVRMAFGRSFYGPLALLHASLLLRIAGDLGGQADARRWGALLSAVALLAFVGNVLRASIAGRRAARAVVKDGGAPFPGGPAGEARPTST